MRSYITQPAMMDRHVNGAGAMMVDLYGVSLPRRDLEARSGSLSPSAGVRLMTLGDGLERDIGLLEFRTGTGLRFTVLVDGALDVAALAGQRHDDYPKPSGNYLPIAGRP